MAFQIDGIDVTEINIDGQPVTELQMDGVMVWTSAPPADELIQFFPEAEPVNPEVGTFWYKRINNPVWWNGTEWKGY